MDQYLATIIVAIITGVFSVITLRIQKSSEKVIKKIDERTVFIEREKELKKKLAQKEKERESIIQDIMILILDTNLTILRNNDIGIPPEMSELSDQLKDKFVSVSKDIEDITKEYELVMDMTSEFQHEIDKQKKKKSA